MTAEYLKTRKIPILLFLSCCAFYFSFAYDLERTDFFKLISLYGGLFFLTWKFFQLQKWDFKTLLLAALIFRLIFLFATPNLSQDFFRFIWDGRMLLHGLNPYLWTPTELAASDIPFPGAAEFLSGMGELSAGNHTSYPPLNQFLFWLGAFFGGNSILGTIIFFRLLIISADAGIFYFGRKLLRKMNLPENSIFWYLLNPFIIIELTGNLHFEGVMLFFLLAALYFLQIQKWLLSSVFLALSVSVKLIPLLFLPLFFRRLGWKKSLVYYAVTGLGSLLLFVPFLSGELFQNFSSSVGLWFQKFEYNASLYYLVRWIGYELKGYNIIQTAGPVLGSIVFFGVFLMSFLKRNKNMKGLMISMLLAIVIYLFLATTVHPWYLATPLLLSIFTKYKFVQVWSLVVVLSYYAYSVEGFEENLWLVAVEYLIVLGVMGVEIFRKET